MSADTGTRLVRHGIVVVIVATLVIMLLVENNEAATNKYWSNKPRSNMMFGTSLTKFVDESGIFGRKHADDINLVPSWRKLFDVGISQSKKTYLTSDIDQDAIYNNLNITKNATSLSNELLTKKKEEFLKKLEKVDRVKIEKMTRNQSDSPVWFEERRIRLTASEFGAICKRKNSTSCKFRVHKMLYIMSKNSTADALVHGKDMEPLARAYFEKKTKLSVKKCGLFIDHEYPFLAASPDGLVGNDCTIEIKCPFLARNSTNIIEAIKNKLLNYLIIENNKVFLKKDHIYYFQIMGQLRVTQRKMCYFVIYTRNWVFIDQIYYDQSFWDKKMASPLQIFYKECLLPEIVDPIFLQRKFISDIRDPEHIKLAQKKEIDKFIKSQRKAYE